MYSTFLLPLLRSSKLLSAQPRGQRTSNNNNHQPAMATCGPHKHLEEGKDRKGIIAVIRIDMA
jgi:hypothetical protein